MKFKQMTMTSAEVVLPLEMRHGVWSALNPETMSIFFMSETLKALEDDVIWEAAKLTGPRCVITEEASSRLKSGTEHVLELHSGLTECARAIPMAALIHMLAFYLAIAKGVNPDKPKGLTGPVKISASGHA